MLSLKQIYCNCDILNTLFNDKDKYNNSVHLIRNKNHQQKLFFLMVVICINIFWQTIFKEVFGELLR